MSLNISIDSRTVISPSDTAFFALTGKNHNGHDYIRPLYDRGVRDFTVSEWREEFASMEGAVFHRTDDTLKALQRAAAAHRDSLPPECEVTAVTGSNGKTIVKEWIAQLFSGDTTFYRSPKSFNSQVGVPLALLDIPDDSLTAIIEAGISLPGEMDALEKIISPSVGIFTHLGDAHGDHFTSPDEKLREKCILFRRCRTVICREGSVADKIRTYLPSTCRVAGWSITEKERTDCARRNIILSTPFSDDVELEVPFTDEASIENCMNAAAFMLRKGISPDVLRERVKNLQPVAMRMEVKEGVNHCTLINDFYNSDPASLISALEALRAQKSLSGRAVILSDFIDTAADYRDISSQLAKAGVELFIGIGPHLCAAAEYFSALPCTRFYHDTDAFIRTEERNSYSGMAVLIKGARDFRFEYIAGFLQKQSHTTVLEVDLDAMAHNLNCFRSLLPCGTKTAVMVKASTYGAGTSEIASMLQYQGVDYLMVAYGDEGVELRSKGITTAIGVMNPEPESFDNMIEFDLEPEIYSLDLLEKFETALLRHGIDHYPVHIKLNTGMNRSGLDEKDIPALLHFFSVKRCAMIKSVFSHLATADDPSEDEFTHRQLDMFKIMSDTIQNRFGHHIIRHILNSAGIERFTEYAFDMVRLGIGLHGIGFGLPLKPVSSFITHIISVRDVEPGQTIGYGRHGIITKPSRIAVIPVGYADGLDRHLSCGSGVMYAEGYRVPIIGNICMDACMLDITGTDLKIGDRVEIFGQHIPVTELSDRLGTIPYEILTGIAPRVKRIYFHE